MAGLESVSAHAHHAIPKLQTVISEKLIGIHHNMRFVWQGHGSRKLILARKQKFRDILALEQKWLEPPPHSLENTFLLEKGHLCLKP